MGEGRELEKLVRQGVQALERNAKAGERLVEIAEREQIEFQMEPGPPICPQCGKSNPTITQLADDGSGPLAQFVLVAETHCCNATIYGVVEGWQLFIRPEEASDYIRERAGNV